MATASETIADIVRLKKDGPLATNEGYISNNRLSGVVTNPIYQVPSGKYAEVILHLWTQSGGTDTLGAIGMGEIRSGVTNGWSWLRYLNDFKLSGVVQELSSDKTPSKGYGPQEGFYMKDCRFFLDENMYIFRTIAGSYIGTDRVWDMTIILRNRP